MDGHQCASPLASNSARWHEGTPISALQRVPLRQGVKTVDTSQARPQQKSQRDFGPIGQLYAALPLQHKATSAAFVQRDGLLIGFFSAICRQFARSTIADAAAPCVATPCLIVRNAPRRRIVGFWRYGTPGGSKRGVVTKCAPGSEKGRALAIRIRTSSDLDSESLGSVSVRIYSTYQVTDNSCPVAYHRQAECDAVRRTYSNSAIVCLRMPQ